MRCSTTVELQHRCWYRHQVQRRLTWGLSGRWKVAMRQASDKVFIGGLDCPVDAPSSSSGCALSWLSLGSDVWSNKLATSADVAVWPGLEADSGSSASSACRGKQPQVLELCMALPYRAGASVLQSHAA